MIEANDLSALQTAFLTEREALVAAAVLPHLPDGEVLLRIHDRDEYEYDDTERFKANVPTIAGTSLYRVTDYHGLPHRDKDAIELEPQPHSTATYIVSGHDVHRFGMPEDGDPDFDDTDQTFLSDFGLTPSPIDAVHADVGKVDDTFDDTFDRKPVVPV